MAAPAHIVQPVGNTAGPQLTHDRRVAWRSNHVPSCHMTDDSFYTEHQRELQDQFSSRPLADRLELAIVTDVLDDRQQAFIASRDYFYLSTVNAAGEPTVSYKGGDVGHVSVVDESTLAFPIYDGNGMFLSAGNMAATGKVGMLFIDFETPQRVRVQGDATVDAADELMASYPGAILICRVGVTTAFVNCARYIHKHVRIETSAYVPDDNGDQPHPTWKRIDGMQDVLSGDDQARTVDAGGVLSEQDYGAKLMAGES